FLLLSRVPQNGCSVPWFNSTSRSSRVSADSSARRCSGEGGERSKSYVLSPVGMSVGDISRTPSIHCCFVHKQKSRPQRAAGGCHSLRAKKRYTRRTKSS